MACSEQLDQLIHCNIVCFTACDHMGLLLTFLFYFAHMQCTHVNYSYRAQCNKIT